MVRRGLFILGQIIVAGDGSQAIFDAEFGAQVAVVHVQRPDGDAQLTGDRLEGVAGGQRGEDPELHGGQTFRGDGDRSLAEFSQDLLEGRRRQRRPASDERPEGSGGLFLGLRLDEIPGGSGSKGTVDGTGVIRMGVGDPLGRAPIGCQPPEAVETGQPRHRQVDQRDVHRIDGQGADGLLAIREKAHRRDAGEGADKKIHRIEDEPIVIDERDAEHLGRVHGIC